MTFTPEGSKAPTAPPAGPGPAVPAQAAPASRSPLPLPAPDGGPPRRTAFAEGVDQLRAAATTEPGRLRIIGAVLAFLVVAFGSVTAWQMNDRSSAADDVLYGSQRLSSAAAEIYSSLAAANTAASDGFLAGGQETPKSREVYEREMGEAAKKLAFAATASKSGSDSEQRIAKLNALLPEYKGLVERARANNRLGYPLGGAYLRYANDKMQIMLGEAQRIYDNENERLRDDYADATAYPWAAIGLGVLAIGGLVWAQRRNYRRTNRVLNQGLVAATAASTVVLLWLAGGHTVARSGLNDSYEHGVRSLTVLNDARIASLTARGNENLTLISRGAETATNAKDEVVDKFDLQFDTSMATLEKQLAAAEALADDDSGERPLKAAGAGMEEWKKRHGNARTADEQGDYQCALAQVIGGTKTTECPQGNKPTGECFDEVDTNLGIASKYETAEFRRAAEGGRNAMLGLPVGAAVLAVLGAAGAILGIGRRLSEYR
ncbi:hypothetical protein [Streptomyces griseiscabiei]|uniref:Secreted protein n=1 Tax=Streptomyces griseiscabiei TaxID=2993540 RepID=A0ABU4L0F5_9ACTN|nr:hypothetical protein [Streptomyces griseiscabiei]MBZ3900797.1 hypothetical protein [Streptomyces griseiscabiei]MDX2909076.1 hypothetical protein [Streptomyces griseiscabiei]